MKKENILKRLIPYMENRKYLIPLALVLGGVAAIFSASPFVLIWLLIRKILDNPTGFQIQIVENYLIWIAICAVLGVILYFVAVLCAHLAAFRVEVGLQKMGMKRLLNKPLGFFDTVESGKLRKVINEGSSTTHQFLAHQLVDLSGTMAALSFIFISMFVIDWRMGLVSLIPLIIAMVLMMSMMGDMSNEYMNLYTAAMDDMSNQAIEYVRGIPVVKAFGQSVFSFKKFYDSIMSYQKFAVKYTLMWKNKYSLCTVILNAATIFLAPFIILFYLNNGDIKMIISNYIFYLIILPNFIMIIMRSAMFQKFSQVAELALDRIEETLDFEDIVYPENSKPLENYDIEFKDVVFSYPGAEFNAIDKISFKISQGERVALVGASGSGKTTIARLAARFWDADEGEIKIGGQNIKTISKENLMNNISFVFQNTSLFSKSIRENIIMGNENVTEKDIKRAIKLSMSEEIVDNLENGIDTIIGTKGTYLSGGEQQRISLARAILKDSPIVILDEATAYADPENENKLQNALHSLSKDKTTLMILHRLSSVKDVDRILVISDGKIVEEGSHEELIKLDKVYAQMYREYESSILWQLKRA